VSAPPVTEEKDLYRTAFDDFARRLEGSEPAWLAAIRTAAMARFAELGFPKPRDEDWKYTNVAPIVRTAFRPAEDDDDDRVTEDDVAALRLSGAAGPEAVFVNGRLSPELSSLGELPRGVEILSLREALRRQPELLEAHLAQVASEGMGAFAALNTAFFEDGALVQLAPNTALRDPIHLVFFSTNGGRPTVSYPRNLIVAGRGSQATIVESYGGADGQTYLTCSVTEVVAGEGAGVTHYTVQEEGKNAFHVGLLAARQERDSRFRDHSLALGAALARRDVRVLLAAEGAECELLGLFLAEGQQHTDTHTYIDHARPHGTSRELYKGIVDGKARGVFTGKIVVRKDAQKTDSQQTNKNLLLSREALVNSTPALEILADDVKCKHGSTTGQLDPGALFYLRSRGLSEPEARALLTYAFASDLVSRIDVAPLRSRIERRLRAQLPGGAEALEAAV
jgi:Fe-S cluster assembly protein SufD